MAKRVKEAHSFDVAGVPITMRVGELVEDTDPRLIGREAFYEDANLVAARSSVTSVETASAAPGERRAVIRKNNTDLTR